MEPLLHNRKSTVVIKRKTGPLKRYDVALYRRPHKKEYVLHRVVKVLEDGYLIRGDNRIWREKVPEEWVVGVMTGYFETEENRYVSCECKIYRKYLKSLKKRYWMRWTAKLPSRIWKRQHKRRVCEKGTGRKSPGAGEYKTDHQAEYPDSG